MPPTALQRALHDVWSSDMLMPEFKEAKVTNAFVATPTQQQSHAILNAQRTALETQSRNVGIRGG